jgi:hypothetical protein
MTVTGHGPGAWAGAEAGERISGDPQLDTSLTVVRQAAATGPRRQTVIVICRIVRPAPQSMWAAAAGLGAQCVACPAELVRVPPAVAIVEAPAARIRLLAGICARCAARHDRDLIAAAYATLRALTPLCFGVENSPR